MPAPAEPFIPFASAAESDASCRLPVTLLWLSASVWLLVSSALALIAAIQLHAPAFLAGCAWLTYGHSRAAAENIFLYGFASQAAIAMALWLMSHAGRTWLVGGRTIFIATLFWNLGVLVGACGILAGDGTGHEWLEFPRYASSLIFFSYLFIATCGLLTFHARREPTVSISQWFVFAALFWFAWAYATANLLLIFHPVRGTMQSAVAYWFANAFATLWLGGIGLAALFYFLPRLSRQPLESSIAATFGFWGFVLFGALTGIPAASGLPAWMSSLSGVAGVLLLVPLYAFALNWRRALVAGVQSAEYPLKFFKFAAIAFLVAGGARALMGIAPLNRAVELTFASAALHPLWLYGFFAMTAFGTAAVALPTPSTDAVKTRSTRPQFLCATIGVVLLAGGLAGAGLMQGAARSDATISFLSGVRKTLPFLGIATLGILLQGVANALSLRRVCQVACAWCVGCCGWRSRSPAYQTPIRKSEGRV